MSTTETYVIIHCNTKTECKDYTTHNYKEGLSIICLPDRKEFMYALRFPPGSTELIGYENLKSALLTEIVYIMDFIRNSPTKDNVYKSVIICIKRILLMCKTSSVGTARELLISAEVLVRRIEWLLNFPWRDSNLNAIYEYEAIFKELAQ